MTKSAVVTGGDVLANRMIADYLLDRGFRITLLFADREPAERYEEQLPAHIRADGSGAAAAADSEQAASALKQAIARMGDLDLLIHGNEWLDEHNELDTDPGSLDRKVTDRFRQLYALTRTAVLHMARKKKGQIVFPLLSDTMRGIGYPSSPILNNGKIAMMKSLARELAPFRIGVNAVTFGYGLLPGGDGPEDAAPAADRKSLRQSLEIYAVKPTVLPFAELLSALDWFIHAADHRISGQNIHVGAGVDTPI